MSLLTCILHHIFDSNILCRFHTFEQHSKTKMGRLKSQVAEAKFTETRLNKELDDAKEDSKRKLAV